MATIANAISNITTKSHGVISHNPVVVNWDSEIIAEWFEEGSGVFTNSYSLFSHGIVSNTSTVEVRSRGSLAVSVFISSVSRLTTNSYSDIYVTANKQNWVKWAKIGSLDFTIDKSNIAGERPVDWKGLVYATKKLSNKVVVYGENGVSFLLPVDTSYGLNTIHRIGLKGKNAITGNESVHFFIDKTGQLYRLSESLERLDYSEFLAAMSNNVVMSYDASNRLVYICDGGTGYVYDLTVGSMGKCQPNITGIDTQSETLYIGASEAIQTLPFEICTDVYDLGTNEHKTINAVEIAANVTTPLYFAIEYRRDIDVVFVATPWVRVPRSGKVFIQAFGRDFRFRMKTENYEQFTLSYLRVFGITHQARILSLN